MAENTPSESDGAAARKNQRHDANQQVAWTDLPSKNQLAIVTFARMSEPLVQTSLRSYMFYQLRWFDKSLSDAAISRQAGILFASFTAAQLLTAILWGRLADSKRVGRKNVILIGLIGTSLSCVGYGFSTSFWQALTFRTLGGCLNGNVAVMRTIEIITEKKFQARAFLLLPMASSIGAIVGPILGGLLSDPATSYPDLFGSVPFFLRYPYAAANIVSALLLLVASMAIWLGLEETLESLRGAPSGFGLCTGHKLARQCRKLLRRNRDAEYTPLSSAAVPMGYGAVRPSSTSTNTVRYTQVLSFRRIFTRNLSLTMLAQFFLTLHVGTFNSLWFVFLSTPVWDPRTSNHGMQLPFRFTGGVGLQPQSVGLAMAILGVIGLALQVLLYPPVAARLGTLSSWRASLLLFPMAYFVVPYLSVVPSESEPPQGKTGPGIWLFICAVLFIYVLASTFALPSGFILTNNCSPHPSVLATVHGIGHSVSSLARTIGPIVGGVVYGFGLSIGYVSLAFWMLVGAAMCACLASLFVKDGDGHEIWLEGDEDAE
ncbi:Major facilitator superfamily domain, general substrate transporter [Metarhizium rileyi]|uniref:Major facilitator superfamily domain, general substrate transporter n=1 Tax=Metarhizium rileyi (strain RCEF 4871) TaxID=1649241 RepID=A0A162JX41_METRR|nr:Major facilitator superfamily domain, general substrate transporter [Metarhizium rileyi RCEF 4871]